VAEPLEREAIRKLAAACALSAALLDCRDATDRLPSLPRFPSQNEVSVSAFGDADRRARERPVSAHSVGRLGMLYHAYQFLAQARVCYEIARELAPGEFRWIYYSAKLEKTAFNYEASEAFFLRALQMKPEDAELWAELGDLYLLWARAADAARHLEKALELDPLQPTAALGKARLLSIDQKWQEVIGLMTPLLGRHPRLSAAHRYLAAAYGAMGMEEKRAFHQEQGEYGSAVESPLVRDLDELAVPALLEGDPATAPELIQRKCSRCHNQDRIQKSDENRLWWARTVRRMQRQAGWDWLTDDEAAAVVAYLSAKK
jgi:tetratricopeptide (TPR) repeat protein